jgi:type IV pilus assembly protein PilO
MSPARPGWTNTRITARHWHYALVGLLVLLNLVLAVRLAYAWQRARAGDAAQLRQRESQYQAMRLKTRPLRGLDRKIRQAKLDQQAFYGKRFPASDSAVLKELGALAVKNNVLLSREQYAYGKLDQGVYEIRLDASLSGDYAPIVRFINDLERDNMFFLIDGIALSGQQSGIVSLRMVLTTFLRSAAGSPGSTHVVAEPKTPTTPRNAALQGRP